MIHDRRLSADSPALVRRITRDGGRRALHRTPPPDYYVSTAGSDTAGDGTEAAPWASLSKALASVPSAGGVRVGVAPGTYAENTSALGYLYVPNDFDAPVTVERWGVGEVVLTNVSGSYCVRFEGATNVRLRGLTVRPATTTNGAVTLRGACSGVALSECVVEANSSLGSVYADATFSGDAEFTDCEYRPKAGYASAHRCYYHTAGSGRTSTVTHRRCEGTGSHASSAALAVLAQAADANPTTRVVGGSWSNALSYAVHQMGGALYVSGGATITATDTPALVFGRDGVAAYPTTGSVVDSTVHSATSHSVLIGRLTEGVECRRNAVPGGDYGVVVKECAGAVVADNEVSGTTDAGVYVKAATGPTITGNDVAAAEGYCVRVLGNLADTGNQCEDVTLTGNTLTATGSAYCLEWGDAAEDAGGGVCDANTYDHSASSGNVGTVRGTAGITTLAGLQAAWSGYDTPGNDANSTVIA